MPLALLVACGTDSDELPSALDASLVAQPPSLGRSEWSEPVNLGAPINSGGDEFGATLSADGLSIYFNSDRTDLPGAQGGNDIWVSRRACAVCPWGTPANLAALNDPAGIGGVSFSNDGLVMFFNSGRTGGFGRGDIYMSRRVNPQDDFGWEAPVNLGPDVNTADAEAGPAYVETAEGGAAELYFARGVVPQQKADIYVVHLTRNGQTIGPAVPISELNDPTVNDGGLAVRTDGRELIFWSNRGSPPGAVNGDLFVSTRRSVHDAWSPPERLATPLNTAFDEITARMSRDGRTLLITSRRPGGLGGTVFGFDIWMATRTPSGR